MKIETQITGTIITIIIKEYLNFLFLKENLDDSFSTI